MGRHRAPTVVSEAWQHVGWGALFLWVVLGFVCIGIGFACCMGALLRKW